MIFSVPLVIPGLGVEIVCVGGTCSAQVNTKDKSSPIDLEES